MNKSHLFAAMLLTLPSLAGAQTASAIDATLSFSSTSVRTDSGKMRQNAFNLVSDVVFSDLVSLGFDADYGQISASGSDMNLDLTRLQLEPTLHLSNGIYIGAYMQRATTSVLGMSIGLDGTGAFAGYDAGMWAVEGYFGTTSMEVPESPPIGDMPNAKNTGLTVTVRPMENLEIFAHGASTRIDGDSSGPIGDLDLRAFGVQYNLNNGVMFYGAYQTMQLGLDSPSLDQTAIGVGFDLLRLNSSIPGTITLELARNASEGDSSDTNIASIGWVMPIGKAKATPLSSIARTARGGIRGAFVAGAGSMSLLSSIGSPG